MKTTKIAFFAATIVALLMVPPVSMAGMPGGFMGPAGRGPGLTGMKAFLELKLTPAQQEKMLNIVSRFEKEREALRGEAHRAERRLMSIMRTEKFDETALRQAHREVSSTREDLFVLRAGMMQELKGLLTPEQLDTLDRTKKERRGKWRDRIREWEEPKSE